MTLPAVPDTFHWTHEPWGAALRCRPLEAIAPHLFTTRQLSAFASAEASAGLASAAWDALGQALGVTAGRVWRVRQVHGNKVIVARGDAPDERADADALVSTDSSVALAVLAADCVPLLMADARTGAVRVQRAGWNGKGMHVMIERRDGFDPCLVMLTAGKTLQPGPIPRHSRESGNPGCHGSLVVAGDE